jgi:hypothetical protein
MSSARRVSSSGGLSYEHDVLLTCVPVTLEEWQSGDFTLHESLRREGLAV